MVVRPVFQRGVGRLADVGRGGKVGVTHAEVDHVQPAADRLLFQTDDLVHQIDGQFAHPFGLACRTTHRR